MPAIESDAMLGNVEGASASHWEELFWQAFRRSSNAMTLLDGDRRHVEVNGAYLQLLGYPRSALIGHKVSDFVFGGPVVSEARWRQMLGEEQFSGTVELVTADGGRVRAEFAGHPELVTGRHLVLVAALRTVRGARRLAPESSGPVADGELSEREREITELVARGLSGPEIAAELQLSHNTVRTHVRNAMNKLDTRSRAHLVAKALGIGLYFPASPTPER